MMTKQPQWRVVQIEPERFEVQKRRRFFGWRKMVGRHSLNDAQQYIEKAIFSQHALPRIVLVVNSDVEYVRQKLST